MTQVSYFFDGSGGDADLQPIDSAEFAEVISALFTFDRSKEGVIASDESPWLGMLECSNIIATDLTVAEGKAIVDGRLYTNDASIGFTPNVANNYYTVVLQRHLANQQVRCVLLGPNAVAYPSPTHTAAIWEIELAHVFNNAGVSLTITDRRRFIPDRFTPGGRQGGSPKDYTTAVDDDWALEGTNDYQEGNVNFICGSIVPSSTTVVVDIEDENFECAPLIFLQLYSTQASLGAAIQPWLSDVDVVGNKSFTIKLDSISNLEMIFWLAVGHTHQER